MRRILPADFFDRDARAVARELLGKYLFRRIGGKTLAYRIVETEAYVGPHDKASHSSHGKTARNEPMWGPPGCWYIYFTYGMHYMLNVVTGADGYPAAVLVRGVEGVNGPGRLTKALRIGKRLNGKPAARSSGLWIEDRHTFAKASASKGEKVIRTPRIGVEYAEEWAGKPLRYALADVAKKPKKR